VPTTFMPLRKKGGVKFLTRGFKVGPPRGKLAQIIQKKKGHLSEVQLARKWDPRQRPKTPGGPKENRPLAGRVARRNPKSGTAKARDSARPGAVLRWRWILRGSGKLAQGR